MSALIVMTDEYQNMLTDLQGFQKILNVYYTILKFLFKFMLCRSVVYGIGS